MKACNASFSFIATAIMMFLLLVMTQGNHSNDVIDLENKHMWFERYIYTNNRYESRTTRTLRSEMKISIQKLIF